MLIFNTILLFKGAVMPTTVYENHLHPDPGFPIIFHWNVRQRALRDDILHWHEGLELLYFTEGEGTVVCNAEQQLVRAGQMAAVNSDMLHEIFAVSEECRYSCLILDKALCDGFGLPISRTVFRPVAEDGRIAVLFERIAREMEEKRTYYKAAVKAAAMELLLLLFREYTVEAETDSAAGSRRLEWVKEALAYIRTHYREELSIDGICGRIGISKYYFCRVFREITGRTVVEHINFIRCSMARRMLLSGRYNVSESAEQCGFRNLSYFTRTYKRQFGELPSAKQGLNQGRHE